MPARSLSHCTARTSWWVTNIDRRPKSERNSRKKIQSSEESDSEMESESPQYKRKGSNGKKQLVRRKRIRASAQKKLEFQT